MHNHNLISYIPSTVVWKTLFHLLTWILIMLISVFHVVKLDSSPSASNHVAHSRICSRSSTDGPLWSCGAILLGDRKLRNLLMSLKTLFHLFLALVRWSLQLESFLVRFYVLIFKGWLTIQFIKHLLNLIYIPMYCRVPGWHWDFYLAGLVLQETYKRTGFVLTIELLIELSFDKNVLKSLLSLAWPTDHCKGYSY